MKRKFKVGDRVKCVDNGGWPKPIIGTYGIVKRIGDITYSVEFDKNISGHSCMGTTKYGHGWNCSEDMLELAKNETIVIYRKGDEVIALDKTTGKTGVAKCGPNDTFDFATGARIAFERLLEDPKPEEPEKTPLNVKIVFTKGDDTFKTGHIYEIKGGKLKSPNTDLLFPDFPSENFTKFYSIEEVTDYFKAGPERKLHRGGWGDHLEFIVIEEDPKPEEPKYFTGKVVCIKSGNLDISQGRIYEFNNGFALDNHDSLFPYSYPDDPVKDLDELNKRMWSDFIELKED